jgi:hypothetical protein
LSSLSARRAKFCLIKNTERREENEATAHQTRPGGIVKKSLLEARKHFIIIFHFFASSSPESLAAERNGFIVEGKK